MQIEFKDCEFKHSFYTSSQIDSTKDNRCRGMKTMEMNVRDVYGFRIIGVGHTPLTKLCGFLNMPPPMTKNAYDGLSYWITAAFKQVAKKSMYDASARLRWTKQTTDAGISVEAASQKKGFSSTLGVVIAISIEGFRCSHSFQIMERLHKHEKTASLIPLITRHGSYLIIVILVIPALYLGWKQQELLRSSIHQKSTMNFITLLFMEMVTARYIELQNIYMVQVNLLRSLNVSITNKNVSVWGFVIKKKKHKRIGIKRKTS